MLSADQTILALSLEELDAKIAMARARLEELDNGRRAYVQKMQHASIENLDELMEETHLRFSDLEQSTLDAWKELQEAIRSVCTKLKLR